MSGVTLDELLVEVGVNPVLLDKACTGEHLRDIALSLESWREVARHLGLSSADVETTERNAHSEQERKREILEMWKAKFAFKARYRILIEVLLKMGRADQAQQICRLLVSQQPNEGVFIFNCYLVYCLASSLVHCGCLIPRRHQCT